MKNKVYILLIVCLLLHSIGVAQSLQQNKTFEVKGVVKERETGAPFSGVEVSTESGRFTVTNILGEYRINASVGELLSFKHPDIKDVDYRVKSDEDVDVLVEGFSESVSKRKVAAQQPINYQKYLDSAEFYKKTDIKKSIDFVTQSIAGINQRKNRNALAKAYTKLGEVYQYHKQYDLAIDNYLLSISYNKNAATQIALGTTYLLEQQFAKAKEVFQAVFKKKGLSNYQNIQILEGLGDAEKGLGNSNVAIDFYQRGLKIAETNLVQPKILALNTKIGDAYARTEQQQVADGFYSNTLKLAEKEAPKKAIQEKERVADYFNITKRYDEEIQLRKDNLNQIKDLNSDKELKSESPKILGDSLTAQRINYKIASAYIQQNKLDEAIPFLEESIEEASLDDDLIVKKDATRRLSEIYNYKGDYPKALETYQAYVGVVDSLYLRKEQEIAQATKFNREITSKQNRISSLEQERELNESRYSLALTEQQLFAESTKRQQWIIFSLILGMVLMGLTAYFFYRSTRQQKIANNLLALRSLRSQMNPHFIFNALNSVNNYIAKSDERSANQFISDFSQLMRSVLDNSEEDFIPLSKEIELLQLYVKLEHSRFSEKFDYEIKVDEHLDVDAFKIPPMLLQPYIENAIWHGLRYKEKKGYLKIEVTQNKNEELRIQIVDNGIGRKKSQELKTKNQRLQKSKGMGNIKKRIAILNEMHQNKVEVVVTNLNENETGTKVLLTLKKIDEVERHHS